ncbi:MULTISPECIES: hypothetical protein [Capnocytophaga]|uniref:hypothetical protein n=1 Tax=Capnocytophaga TaxID=1016 RepID=UPI001AC393A9|nr:hypothetical protein [Capnocytophaga canimorsus]GIM59607.1 hypothetical protein CAPN007_18160 [Capnocytophaga canimorsus]
MKPNISKGLEGVIAGESIDFLVFAKKRMFRTVAVFFIIYGVFGVLFFLGLLNDFLVSDKAHKKLLIWSLIFCLLTIHIYFSVGLNGFFRDGGYFVGTPTRLIHYQKGISKIYNWQDFTGNIEMNPKKHYITFYLHTNHKEKVDDRRYMICDIVNLPYVDDVLQIERIARKRINEHRDTDKYIF